jgi:tetratricopeptide (TPR) repeat protein
MLSRQIIMTVVATAALALSFAACAAQAQSPLDAEVHHKRGLALGQSGELDPRQAIAYSNRGNARRANGDLAGAMNDYDQAITLDPRCALAFLNRGIGYLQQGREAEAQRDFDQCLKIAPSLRPELEAVVGEARRRLRELR